MGMYLHRTNKWKEFLLLEAVEDIGLPPRWLGFLGNKMKHMVLLRTST